MSLIYTICYAHRASIKENVAIRNVLLITQSNCLITVLMVSAMLAHPRPPSSFYRSTLFVASNGEEPLHFERYS